MIDLLRRTISIGCVGAKRQHTRMIFYGMMPASFKRPRSGDQAKICSTCGIFGQTDGYLHLFKRLVDIGGEKDVTGVYVMDADAPFSRLPALGLLPHTDDELMVDALDSPFFHADDLSFILQSVKQAARSEAGQSDLTTINVANLGISKHVSGRAAQDHFC